MSALPWLLREKPKWMLRKRKTAEKTAEERRAVMERKETNVVDAAKMEDAVAVEAEIE